MASDAYDSWIRASEEMRSSASRSEMSRAWSDTRRSSGAFHAGTDASSSLDEGDEEHVWATAGDATNVNAAANAIVRGTRDRIAFTA
jgi:hypothetical protein